MSLTSKQKKKKNRVVHEATTTGKTKRTKKKFKKQGVDDKNLTEQQKNKKKRGTNKPTEANFIFLFFAICFAVFDVVFLSFFLSRNQLYIIGLHGLQRAAPHDRVNLCFRAKNHSNQVAQIIRILHC